MFKKKGAFISISPHRLTMTNDLDIKLIGDEALMKLLRSLPGKMGKNIVQSAWVRAAKPIKQVMKQSLPEDSGTAKRSITTVRGKSFKSPTVFIGPRKGGSKKSSRDASFLKNKGATNKQVKQTLAADAWYLKFLWSGTKYITPKTGLIGYESAVNRAIPQALSNFKKELKQVILRAARKK